MTRHQYKHWGIQILRRCLQISIIVLVVGLVFMSLYAHYRAAKVLEDDQYMSGWTGAVLSQIDRRVAPMEDAQSFLDGFKGTLWSMRLAGIDLSDPLAAVEVTAASKTIYGSIWLSVLLPVIATLLLGRVFCSWICPAYLLFELMGKLRKLLHFAEIPPAEVSFSKNNKYVLLGVGLIIAAVVGRPMFALVYPPAVVSRLAHAWIFGTAMTGMLILIGLLLVVELLISPRWWCRTMCPGGALYALIGWFRLLRVRLNVLRCTHCGDCKAVCEPGIDPVFESEGIECDNCGVCVRVCPEKALSYRIGWIGSGRKHLPAPAVFFPVIWLMLLVVPPLPAEGHHVLGLPHYEYKENYPQVPTAEYKASVGPYDVLLTSYPGEPVPTETATLAFYVKNRTTDVPYLRPVTIRVVQTIPFRPDKEVMKPTLYEPFEQLYKVAVTFPEDGDYVIELTTGAENKAEVISFRLRIGESYPMKSVFPTTIAIGVGLTIGLVVVVRAIRIKRARRMNTTTSSTLN